MDLQKVHSILNNKEKSDVFYDERPVWIQGVDEKRDIAKVGFVDNFEEKDVYIEDLYEKDLFNYDKKLGKLMPSFCVFFMISFELSQFHKEVWFVS